jgi:solute carrier family 66 (lysosomal lysine-arginine transporter), member 1
MSNTRYLSDEQGDATNLLGCILTHQLPFQTMLACYFVLVDGILVFQYIFYKILFPPRPYTLTLSAGSNFHPHPPPRSFTPPTTTHPIIINRINPNREFQRTVVSIAITLGFISMVAAEPAEPIPADDASSIIGQVLAWVCCGLYLSSRMPQIRENHRRKSTQGLNIILFLAALSGNVFYTIGILTDPSAHNLDERKDFLMNALPYILGSAG